MSVEQYYYNGIAKDCKNCFWYRRWVPVLSKCKKYPNIMTEDALVHCQYKE